MSAGQGAVLSSWFLTFITRYSGNTGSAGAREGAGGAGDTVHAHAPVPLHRPVSQALGRSATREMDQCAKVYGEGLTDPSSS